MKRIFLCCEAEKKNDYVNMVVEVFGNAVEIVEKIEDATLLYVIDPVEINYVIDELINKAYTSDIEIIKVGSKLIPAELYEHLLANKE